LLVGRASVLYTFYPPVQANALFYVGALLLVVGSWAWCAIMIVMQGQWKQEHPGEPVPLPMFGTTANAILWFWTSVGVGLEVVFQLIPWALGLRDTVDVGLARTLSSWTLHPIVYFWLFPAYIAMYVFAPEAAGGHLFSDEMVRIAFVTLLVFSLPIGFHHLYMDPEQSAGFKLSHGVITFLVTIPTLLTGFTITAPLETAGRAQGGNGLFGWIGALPWRNPMVLLGSALLFLYILWNTHRHSSAEVNLAIDYAEPKKPVVALPGVLNGFTAWNIAILVLMLLNFGYPIAQFFLVKTYDATAWGY
jgi:cytochrome c oxidase subunit 1